MPKRLKGSRHNEKRKCMKRMIKLATCCLAIFLLSACGEKKITVKGVDGTEYESYQECCAANDFTAAHQFLAKMEKYNEPANELAAAKKIVFKKEALYLMSMGDEEAKKRIIYLLKEDENNVLQIPMLIDLAIDNDDADFVMALINQYGRSIRSIPKLSSYLLSKNTTEYSDIVLKSLPVIDLQRPPIGTKTFYGTGGRTSEFEMNCKEYQEAVTKYNSDIIKILNEAIVSKNQYVAKNVFSRVIPNSDVEVIGFVDNVHYRYKVSVDNHDVNASKALYNEAIKNGSFSN